MKKNTPFFSNFIESQIEELNTEEAQQCSGGFKPGQVVTMKAPSDDDEGGVIFPFPPINVTMKAPSDDDEGNDFPTF